MKNISIHLNIYIILTKNHRIYADFFIVLDYFRQLLNTVKDDNELESEEEQNVDAYILSHIIHELSNTRNAEASLSPYHSDGRTIYSRQGLQKRSKWDSKRTKDMSRLAMRILKRSQGQSRVAYRILKKRERGNNARIAMRVLRKRDGLTDYGNFNRVTRASPYSNIGGYFGGMSLGKGGNYPTYYPVALREIASDERKRSECTSNCDEDYGVQGQDEEA